MAKVLIPAPLAPHASGLREIEVSGATVAEVLSVLTEQHAGLKKHIFNDEGKLRSFINVYLNDEDIRFLDREASSVAPGDVVSLVPSIAGGH